MHFAVPSHDMPRRPFPPSTAIAGLIVAGLVLEAAWLATGILGAWVTDVPSFTASMRPDGFAPWAWLHGWVESLYGHDRTGITPPPPVQAPQVAFLWSL